MKRVKKYLCLLGLVCICGCQNKTDLEISHDRITEDNSEEIVMDYEEGDIGTFSIGYVDDVLLYTYSGGVVTVPFQVNTIGSGIENLGLLVFVEGQPVIYTVSSDDIVEIKGMEYEYLHCFEKTNGENCFGTLEFTPPFGKKGDVLSMRILGIINPILEENYSVEKKALSGGMGEPLVAEIDMECDSMQQDIQSKNENYTVSEISDFQKEKYDLNFTNLMYKDTETEEVNAKYYVQDGKVSIPVQLLGGSKCSYWLIPCIDCEPVNKENWICIPLEVGQCYDTEFQLDIDEISGETKCMILAVPYGLESFSTQKPTWILSTGKREIVVE